MGWQGEFEYVYHFRVKKSLDVMPGCGRNGSYVALLGGQLKKIPSLPSGEPDLSPQDTHTTPQRQPAGAENSTESCFTY
jgi:hypothetical protein